MIDLSFLTEEEQEAIMKVLQRDAELKRTEEERVRHLPEKVKDHVQLKNMSGQWFYEAKSKRHRDKIHGADIIRASMRRKPATIAEVGQNKTSKAKISWVNNVNKEVFMPPDLNVIVEHQEEEQQKTSLSSKEVTPVLNKLEERPVKPAVSSVRQRRNPFNSIVSDDNLNSVESEDRPVIVPQLSKKETWSLSEDSPPKSNLQNDETDKPEKPSVELTDESQEEPVKRPVPKARKLIHKAADSVSQREDLAPKPDKQTERINGIGTPPKGILKRSSSSSSTDSEVRVSQMLDVQKKNGLATATIFEGEGEKNSLTEEAENSAQNSLEKLKQVRFSSSSGKGKPLQSPQLHHAKEKGEHDILRPDKKKNSGNYAVQSDSYGDKQIPAAKPLGTYSSTLKMKTIDGLQEDTSAFSPCDSNRSVFSVSESFQTNTVTPKKLETSQKTSSNILSNSNNEWSVDETHEKKPSQILSHELESHKNFTDGHQLSAETCEVFNTDSTSLQQGKTDLVEERDAKTIFKPGKHADELMKVDDKSVSKVLDWFKRSSSTEDEEVVSTKSQGRESREEVDNVSIRTAVLPTEHSGPGMHGKTEDREERLFGKIKQQSRISSTSFTSENIQLIKETVKPKTGEANEKQNDKLLTEFDCTRVKEKEHGQEIKQQNKKSSLLEHQGHKQPAQKCESEKAIQEKRRIREIRAFWERNKTAPSHGEKEVSINVDASGGRAFTGLGESDQLKRSTVYLPKALHDQSKNTLRSPELSCASHASRNKSYHSLESGPAHAFEKPEGTLQSDELPKSSNLYPRAGVTSASSKSKDKDEKETLKGKVAAFSQEKPSFQVLSLTEKMNEKSKNQILDPSHFQSLRNFWDTGVKLQSSIDREDDPSPNNTRSITYERKSKEDKKGRDNVSKQGLIQQQTQTSEREKPQKLDPEVCKKSLGSPILKGLNVTHTKNTGCLQLDRQPAISKSQEKMDLPEQEVRECIEKSILSSKDYHVSSQLQSPGDKDTLKETVVGDKLYLPLEKGENKTTPLDKEEVAETVDKVVLPKGSEEELNPVLMALKRSADRKKPSKSLEDIPSATSNKEKINKPKEELVLSAEDVSTVTSQPDKPFSNPEKLKGLSKSVPSFLQQESDDRETDTASESSYSFGRIKKSPSSLTNLSSSSGMASLSSVSSSLMSIYSADFGNVDVKGNIQFAIDYVEQLNELHIFICQCKDLAVADVKRQRSDPYVKTYLLPEKYRLGKRKTSIKKKTFNPVYNEILRYKIEKELLKNQSLNISVWHNDTFGRNSFLGEVELDLGAWVWNDPSSKQINWFPLKPRTSAITLNLENRGEMKLALQYVPHPIGGKKTLSTGEVHIWVKECHNLPLLRGNRLNSFIKCTILPDTSRKSRQKTRTVTKTTNPVFNHTMVYDGFRPEDLKEACIELTVWDHNKLANHFLGGLRIGLGTGKSYGTTVDWMDSTSDETALWEKMMNSPNTWIEDILPLRMLMVAKLTK
ncbi:synaptotagmin-like protein 2 isoform X1 [Vidua chalybeata]|uniref:synaptotagmin-like protein 2 isoform X1 n=1 Tax=Vidua chalybeata TaxID=81927 RepID=UPI0023A80FEB|nr:synaptotagmin-like protein 2 isoform X1 [Vidua chalybeata]XP_053790876.1 synaptotagmin-like protein 2 isoform X1 [Vidua chalybeata]